MKFVRIISVALVGVVLLAGFASATNALVVKPIRLHFALASGCKTINAAGTLNKDSSQMLIEKVAGAFIKASRIDRTYLDISQAAIIKGVMEVRPSLNDAGNLQLWNAKVLLAAFCG